MRSKLMISLEFDDDYQWRLDADLARIMVFSVIPSLPSPDQYETKEWGKIDNTEWKKIKKIIEFETIILLNHDELKIQIEAMTLDLKRTKVILGSEIMKSTDEDKIIRDDDGILIGKVVIRNESYHEVIHKCHRFMTKSGWVFVNSCDSRLFDPLKTQNVLLSTVIAYGDHLMDHWGNSICKSGYLSLIRDSLICGIKIRVEKCRHWLNVNGYFQSMELDDRSVIYEAFVEFKGENPQKMSTICWNFSWIKEQRRISSHSDAAKLTHIYTQQAVASLSDMLKRKVFAIRSEIKKIELAASTNHDSHYIVQRIKTNLYEICLEINELVSTILMEISKNKNIPQNWTEDINFLMSSIQVQILPSLNQSPKNSQITFGQILKQATSIIQEMILRVDRLLQIQLTYLTESAHDGNLSKKAWWSGLLYEKEFMVLLHIISLLVQRQIQNLINLKSGNLQRLFFGTGFLFPFYSDITPDTNNIGIFEDLAYRLQEIRKRIKIRFHSCNESSELSIKINPLYATMSFPVPDQISSTNSKVDIIPLLFIPNIDSDQKLWVDDFELKTADINGRVGSINSESFKNLESFVKKVMNTEISISSTSRHSFGNSIDISLKLLKSEIQGTSVHFWTAGQTKHNEIHLTSIAYKCITKIGKSLACTYNINKDIPIFTGIWLQEGSIKSPFHHETIALMEDSFGIFIDKNWSKE